MPQIEAFQPAEAGKGERSQLADFVVVEPKVAKSRLGLEGAIGDGDELVVGEIDEFQLGVEVEAGVHRVELVVAQDEALDRRVQTDWHHLQQHINWNLIFEIFSKINQYWDIK